MQVTLPGAPPSMASALRSLTAALVRQGLDGRVVAVAGPGTGYAGHKAHERKELVVVFLAVFGLSVLVSTGLMIYTFREMSRSTRRLR
jgi:ABC-type nitrate/sulfonate/bicarbonate transport system permease component